MRVGDVTSHRAPTAFVGAVNLVQLYKCLGCSLGWAALWLEAPEFPNYTTTAGTCNCGAERVRFWSRRYERDLVDDLSEYRL